MAKSVIGICRVRSHLRHQSLIEPKIQSMHAFSNFISVDPISIHISHREVPNAAVPENAPTAVLPPTMVTAPDQEVRVADVTINSHRAITLWKPNRTNKSHG